MNSAFLIDGGVTGALVREMDWSRTPVGAISSWPRSLAAAVGMVLHSRHPMFLWWGAELTQFYNDAYLPSFGQGKHPAAMGQAGRECWGEIWPIIGPQIDGVMQHARATWHEDALVPIERNGKIEEVYWTYGYSPVFDDDGAIGGVLVVCTETTARVLANRREAFLRALGERLAACSDANSLGEALTSAVQSASADVPFVVIYATGKDTEALTLAGAGGLSAEQLASVDAIAAPLGEQAQAPGEFVQGSCEFAAGSPAVADAGLGAGQPAAFALTAVVGIPRFARVVFGLSSRLSFDEGYRLFLREVVEQVSAAAVRIEAYRVRALFESERRNLLEQAPVPAALMIGPQHVYAIANPSYRASVGGRELVGKSYAEAFPELAGSGVRAVLDHVYATGEPFTADEYLVQLDRAGTGVLEDCYYRIQIQPVRDELGKVYGMMLVAGDVTAQVMSRKVLERATAEREKLLTQLEAASLAKDEFLATVSHELRTPLTSILGWSRLLNENTEPARLKKGLGVITRNAQAQSHLIEDILDVSRIISGKLRMTMRPVELAGVVNGAVETIRVTANSKQLSLLLEIQDGMSQIVGDEDRLQQVVWNLLSNAVKFTPVGGQIRVRAAQVDGAIVITVEDNGRGIDPAFLPAVFDRFRQDDTSTTKVQAGLGLGLAIVRHLVELHGGTVAAHSDGLGQGARFEVTLPIRAVFERGDSVFPPESVPKPKHDARPLPLRGARLLVVDDQTDARDLIATVLEDAGASVSQAASAPAALSAIGAVEPFHAIISDIGMPGVDGYTFMEALRREEARRQSSPVPALAVTAYARAEDRVRALQAGFHEHAAKPINPGELVRLVAGLLER